MQAEGDRAAEMRVRVDDIGGIDHAEFTFTPGITVLAGRNATNRTSLLNAIAGGLGGSGPTVRGGAETGGVTIDLGGATYDRRYRRRDGETVPTGGTPYATEATLVDTFVRLLRDNPIRRRVGRDEDLRELLMRPVDTAAIEERVRETRREREEIAARLEEIDRRRDRLPDLERRRSSLEAEIAERSAELDALRERVETGALDRDAAGPADELLSDLEDRRRELSELRDRIETQRASIDALRDEREEVNDELAELDGDGATADGGGEGEGSIDEGLDRLRTRVRDLSDSINDLSAIVEFNRDLLESGTSLGAAGTDGDVTAALDPGSATVECWTCGSDVERGAIRERLDELESVIGTKRSERRELRERIERLQDRREERRRLEERRARLEDRLTEIDEEIERRETRVAGLRDRVEALRDTVRDLEADLEDSEALGEAAESALEGYRRISELEYERGRLEQELADIDREIEDIEGLAAERDRLEGRREDLAEELTDLRTRVERREREVIETFNEHMARLLDRLDYENVERVWIERRVEEGSEGNDVEATFDLHVVRRTPDGTAYEDSLHTLSESEREVVGLVVALAGYLAHDVQESVPVVLLDSLEAIDAERIATLVDYLGETVTYLFVALLPEDARAIPETHPRVTFGT